MARNIDSKSAKRVVSLHKLHLNNIKTISEYLDNAYAEIGLLADKVLKYEIDNSLKNIPVEELNRNKKGIRVKTLRDNGYTNIYDICRVSASKLAGIGGISSETAITIKQAADEMAKLIKDSTHLKLSSDNKNPASTALVSAISKYLNLLSIRDLYANLSSRSKEIISAINSVSPLTGSLKWFFASKAQKSLAEKSYTYLLELSEGEYGDNVLYCESQFKDISAQSNDVSWAHFNNSSVLFFNILEEAVPHLIATDDTMYGLPEDLAKAIQDEPFYSDGLKCTLRRYQEWGVKYALHQKRVLLGDEMGLGKTVQAIAVMVSLHNCGGNHFVVVCPASVITNWCREIQKMSNLQVTKVHGDNRDKALQFWKENGGVAVTTYETTEHFKIGDKFRFSMIVVDEAHYIKNPEAQRSKNVKAICNHAQNIMLMTGTALENKVSEMITLMSILNPTVAQSVRGMEFLSSAPEFREKVAPIYYRRRREDVLTELPELIENYDWCNMGAKEEKVYNDAIMSGNFAAARKVSWNVDDIRDSSKAIRLKEIVEEAKEDGRKVIVFSFFLDTIAKVTSLLGDVCMEPINGSVTPAKRQEIIDKFNDAPAGSVLCAQIQSGGTGLNIQSASVVVLCEPQFKPSIENQAISRAYRMGQTRNVLVHILLCDETIDERIIDILNEKQKIFDAFADESVIASESFELDEKTFGSIIEQEQNRITDKTTETQ